jgi:Holliday junction resolvase
MQYAIEAKAWERTSLHIDRKQFLNLKRWEENTGINCYVGWRRNRKGWLFIPLSMFEETSKGKNFGLSWEKAEKIGKKLNEFILE